MREPSIPAKTIVFHDWKTYGDIPIQFENIKSIEPMNTKKDGEWTRLHSVMRPPKHWDVAERWQTIVFTLESFDRQQALHIFHQSVKPIRHPDPLLI